MPMPKTLPVPHIVGDDEHELDENSPIFPGHELVTDSSLSDSACDEEEDDVVEKGSSSSSSDGADWSMNVTSITATPGNVPIFAATPRMKSAVVVEEHLQSPLLAGEDNDRPMPEMEAEVVEEVEEPSLLSFLNLHPTKGAGKPAGKAAGSLKAQVPAKDGPSPKPAPSRKRRNARAPAQTQSVRNLRSTSGRLAGRVLRPRLDNTLAKPIEITQYFRVVSANLVRNRITLNSFQFLRDGIDRLLIEANEDLIRKSSQS